MDADLVRPVVLSFVACLLLQAAWVLAMPPFRGIDEFDHAYRADSVAQGYWAPSHQLADNGRGGLIPVRRSIVEAASGICRAYQYTGPDNCRPVEELDNGLVTVASGASTYQPVFYWLIGTPAQAAQGASALMLMRMAAAILCALFLAAAVFILSTRRSTAWLRVPLLAGMTPVLIYSTALGAPNGLEMLSGAVVWCALLVLGRADPDPPFERSLLLLLTVAAMVLATLRQLGPLWLALIVLTCLLLNGAAPYLALARSRPFWVGTSTLLTISSMTAGLIYMRSARSLVLSEGTLYENVDRWAVTLDHFALWLLQSIAAFPLRDESAPTIVYVPYLLIGLVAVSAAMRVGNMRQRLALVAFIILTFLIPGTITFITVANEGAGWQGRYALAYGVGFLLLCAAPLEPLRSHWLYGRLLLAAWFGITVAHATSVLSILTRESRNSAVVTESTWPLVGPAPLLLLVVGSSLLAAWASRLPPGTRPDRFESTSVGSRSHD